MSQWVSNFLDKASPFLAHRKGLLPLVGIVLILLNLILVLLLPPASFLVATNLFLHLGLIIALFGLMLAWAL